ncbi:MAG TPA: NUDIX hydrolase, partial [Candidatus Paceibacterota bacterium]
MKTLDGAYVVITDGDLIVTVEHNQAAYDRDLEGQVWGITGGRIDSGETEEDAARREGFEESGVIITNLIKLGTFKSKVISEGRILDNTTHLFWSQENELEKKIRKEATSEICQVKLATPCDIREMRNVFMLSSLRMILMCK